MGSIPAIAPRGPSEPGPMGNYTKTGHTLKSWQCKHTRTHTLKMLVCVRLINNSSLFTNPASVHSYSVSPSQLTNHTVISTNHLVDFSVVMGLRKII